jgi:hypothetical protein
MTHDKREVLLAFPPCQARALSTTKDQQVYSQGVGGCYQGRRIGSNAELEFYIHSWQPIPLEEPFQVRPRLGRF